MKTLNKQSTKIFNKITEGMGFSSDESISYKKIDNRSRAVMALVVECIGQTDFGPIFSLCHYFKQNGDMCQDPEMLFLKHECGEVFPSMFQQAIPPVYEESLYKDHEDGEWKCLPRLQAAHTRFANTWMKNIKEQQKL